ncbi:MAG: anaphase-promoting complex subunit cdc27 [Peltula sp. TS41687]|nr:MAG: anaphase-promoting complex subunit cdc27 [Peltula sp. TS41687]
MSPTNPYVAAQLRHLIYYHLDNNHLRNALFMAGRLHAYEPRSADSVHLLTLCHLRLGELKLAYECGKSQALKGTHLGCAYVFADVCRGLRNGKEKEGITALEKSRGLWGGRNNWNKHTETSRRHLPDAAAVYSLLGKLWHGYGDVKKAVDCYVEAVKLNPFMWDAFLGLCDIGANIRTSNIFKMTPELLAIVSSCSSDAMQNPSSSQSDTQSVTGPLQSQHNNHHQAPSSTDPFNGASDRINGDGGLAFGGGGLFQKLNESKGGNIGLGAQSITETGGHFMGIDTPTGPGGSFSANGMMGGNMGDDVVISAPAAPARAPLGKSRTMAGTAMEFSIDASSKSRPISTRAKSRVGSEVDEAPEGGISTRTTASTTLIGDRKRTISGHAAQAATSQANDPAAAPQRRSVRLFNQIRPGSSKLASSGTGLGFRESRDLKKARATGTKGKPVGTGSTVGRVVSGNRKPVEAMDVDSKETLPAHSAGNGTAPTIPKTQSTEGMKQQEALQWLLAVFRYLGEGYFALTHYHCQEALHVFNTIPAGQRETPWVLAQIGRAYYEQASYGEAEKYFKKIRKMTHSRLEDMEIYSTVLWHLKNEVELSYLAHELIDVERLSPQAWCAIGNTFALQRDHDQAIKCFKRAIQVDPTFAYAFTLQGHEHVANEEYDKALTAYRNAIGAENRHYNAWYGLGNVFEKMGKYDVAEKHYRTAIRINPTNPVLFCYLGGVLERLKNPRAALDQYAEACILAPRSAFPRYKKARVLVELQELNLGLAELKICKDIAPDEANVHFLLGRVYRALRQKTNAIRHYTIALNLDPKAGQKIKMDMESLEEKVDEFDAEL